LIGVLPFSSNDNTTLFGGACSFKRSIRSFF